MKAKLSVSLPLLFGLVAGVNLGALGVKLDIREAVVELAPGLRTKVWAYDGLVPGTPLVVSAGEELVVEATNHLRVPTSIHWHGIELPNGMDGTMSGIGPGRTFTYRFKVPAAGTFWYHSHTRPVLEQVDRGLYGAFIVKAPEDALYSSDRTFVLDDWYLGARGERLEGSAVRDGMERMGNVETVNGKTGDAIPPMVVTKGELHKLRFINASTAAVHSLRISEGQFRVTHTDGHALTRPYLTDSLVIQPGERFDAEFAATGEPGSRAAIRSTDRSLGLVIPIEYGPGRRAQVASPFNAPGSPAFSGIAAKKADFTLVLNSRMAGMAGGMMGGTKGGKGMMGGMTMGQGSGKAAMEWTINDKSYPETEPLVVKVGQVVKMKFINNDTEMMHGMDHPMHLHGTSFQVVSMNGRAPDRETWKDTISVPAGESVEIAFRFRNPGDWMLHCHVLDHEDNGLMTVVRVLMDPS